MTKTDVLRRISESGVLPVIRAGSAADARQLIDAIVAGGIRTIEVTMTVPGAVDLIRELASDPELMIGAGTVLDAETAKRCIDAGAIFVISPATNYETIRYCNNADVVVMPGALTPTEILNAWNAGADIVKVFPASSMGGPAYLRALKGPLPHLKLIPTGGVSIENAADYIGAGAEAVGVGGDLANLDALRAGNTISITEAARAYVAVVTAAVA
jgi:2-dehydro-3-deoxyphosphogluconate aldolase / (4S)-4-hydroxy-2-oxoglutarate aldolase